MNTLAIIFIFKISATIIFWCIPLILLPGAVLESTGFPSQPDYMFVRMLGWAYLSLCVCYWYGLMAALHGQRAMGPIWVGIVSNGGAFLLLSYFGVTGTWASWGLFVQFIGWASAVATFAITVGLYMFGVRGDGPIKN